THGFVPVVAHVHPLGVGSRSHHLAKLRKLVRRVNNRFRQPAEFSGYLAQGLPNSRIIIRGAAFLEEFSIQERSALFKALALRTVTLTVSSDPLRDHVRGP